MTDKRDLLDELTTEQIEALVNLAEDYQANRISRRELLKSAGIGGVAGLVGGASWTMTTDRSREPTNQTVSDENRSDPSVNFVRVGGGDVGGVVASPGNVQEAIEAAASTNRNKVILDPSQRYEQPSSPWRVKENIILDFNGAILYGSGDLHETDMIHVYPGAQVHDPRINLYDGGNGYTRSNGYRGRVFSFDTRFAGLYFAHGTTIRNGHIAAVGDTGTACYLGVNREATAISHTDLNFDVGIPKGVDGESTIGTALHLDTTGAGENGYINGVWVSGHWRYVKTGVLQTGVTGRFNQQSRNTFRVQIQSSDNADYIWHIKDPTWSRLNTWWGNIWDQGAYDDVAWAIDSTYQDSESSIRGCKRNAINSPNFNPDYTRNRSPNTHYVTRTDCWKTTEI